MGHLGQPAPAGGRANGAQSHGHAADRDDAGRAAGARDRARRGRDRRGIWVDGGCSARFALVSERDLRGLGYAPEEKGWRYVGGPGSFHGDYPDYAERERDRKGLSTGEAVAIGLGVLGLAILLDAADD